MKTVPEVVEKTLSEDLAVAWKRDAIAGTMMREFNSRSDDPGREWSKGDRIAFGILFTAGRFEFEGRNLTRSTPISKKVKEKPVGSGFRCQLNRYRLFRMGETIPMPGKQPKLPEGPTHCRFHCSDLKETSSLLRSHPLARVKLKHYVWQAYYNIFPFDKDGHFLWVPVALRDDVVRIPHVPQQLFSEFIEDLLLLGRNQGMVLFFNSLHAGASVNHIHAQSVFYKHPLAIEKSPIRSYKGFSVLQGYPAHTFCFYLDSKKSEVLSCIDRLQREAIPYNMIVLKRRVFIFPRNIKHEVVPEFPGAVLGAMELAGRIVTVDRDSYQQMNDDLIRAAFRKSTLSVRKLVDRWSGCSLGSSPSDENRRPIT